MKNPFKKSSIVDTLINVGVGGAANAAMDYAVANVDMLSGLDAQTVNFIKIGVGAFGGSMVSSKYARAGFDGLATVGASDLIKSYIGGESAAAEPATETPAGVPFIGKIRMGQRGFRSVRGTGEVAFQGK